MSKGIQGDKRYDLSGGLWLQSGDWGPRWKGQIQIDGTIYELSGQGSDQQKSKSPNKPTIKLKASVKEIY